MRLINTVRELGLRISRFAFTGGEPLAPYIEGYHIDLFLSRSERDVQAVIDSGKSAAALLYDPPTDYEPVEDQVRIAFDADAVLFSDDSEVIYQREGLARFRVETAHWPAVACRRALGGAPQARSNGGGDDWQTKLRVDREGPSSAAGASALTIGRANLGNRRRPGSPPRHCGAQRRNYRSRR